MLSHVLTVETLALDQPDPAHHVVNQVDCVVLLQDERGNDYLDFLLARDLGEQG